MQPELIILREYCISSNIEPSFIRLLEEEGLIDINIKEGKQYLLTAQLPDLEKYSRMYYDLSINPAGIDAIHHMLERVSRLQREIHYLQQRLHLYEKRINDEEINSDHEEME